MLSTSSAGRLAVLFGVACVMAGGDARAFGRKLDVRTRVQQTFEKAYGKVKATKEQRAQLAPTVSEIQRVADDAFGGPHGMVPELDDLLRLFVKDPIDHKAIDALKARRQARHKLVADAVEKAVYQVHDALAPAQRLQLTGWVRDQYAGKRMRAFKDKIVDGVVNVEVEYWLDQLSASEPERKAAHAVRDKIMVAVKSARASRGASLDEAATIFVAEAIDKAALSAYRAAQEDKMRGLGDVVEQGLVELHDALSPAHRQQLVDIVRSRMDRPADSSGGGDNPL